MRQRKGIAATISSLIIVSAILAPTLVFSASQDTSLNAIEQRAALEQESAYAPVLFQSIAQSDLSHVSACGNQTGSNSGNGSLPAQGIVYKDKTLFQKTTGGIEINSTLWLSGPGGSQPTANLSSSKVYQVADSCMGLLVPLYMAPGDAWDELITVAKNSSVPIIAIVNPDNGPGNQSNPQFGTGISQLQRAGIRTLAYVDTGRTTIPMLSVEAQIAHYVAWYKVSGVFLDDLAGAPSYYSAITAYADSLNLTVLGNPGTFVSSSYFGAVPILNVFEGDSLPSPALLGFASLPGFKSAPEYSMIATSIQTLPNESYFQSISPFVRYVWVSSTDASYSQLPPLGYLQAELQEIGAA